MAESAGGRFGAALATATGRVLEAGNRVEVVRNGAVFDALESLIATAQKSVHICIYMWKPGHASDRVVHALEERRRAGVPVRVVVDHWGSRFGFAAKVRPQLEQLGCEVYLYGTASVAGTHRKVVVVDGQRALTGGFGISDPFLGDGRAPEEWRDTNVRVDGPVVRFLQRAFLENWRKAGGPLPPLEELPRPQPAGDVVAAFVDSSPTNLGATRAQDLMRVVLSSAKKRLWVSSAYFSPEPPHLEALIGTGRSGIDVRVLVPGPVHDAPPIREAGRGTYKRLFESGVRLWEYQPSMLHTKTTLVDEDLCVVGSINLEPLSMNVLDEGSLVFFSSEIAAELSRDFEADLAHAQEITVDTIPAPALQPERRLFRRIATRVIRGLRPRQRDITPAATSDTG